MKKLKSFLIILGLIIAFSIGETAHGQPPPPVDPNSGGNQLPGGNPPTGAPMAEGTWILLILASGYGLMKFNEMKQKQLREVS